ncbi:glycosyhydrolase [Hanamia caeni]|uniref:Glycosyhydrolase n=1 Tax=Hanamia caeni TaxID=2294116 RepID=A0A3M9NEX8_9BACT|nr:glycosyl hydrolase 115 family protein [Hanamia caeni]RNI36334.1 glycosyhydrolase [Hanamia caeni]
MKRIFILLSLIFFIRNLSAQNFISDKSENENFPIVSQAATPIYTDKNDDWLVQKAVSLFQNDVQMVSDKKSETSNELPSKAKDVIIIGSINGSDLIQRLIQSKKINVDSIKNKWEAYQIQIIKNPFKGVDRALVITGSDKRGTAYGVFEMSKEIGVSPWYWWADVPAKKKKEIFVNKNIFLQDHPLVKYRGIFINDEAPAFSGWAKEKFGGVNHHVYEKVFELLLRLKANYLWPAMWGNAFNDDDTLNPILANKYGIVMGTSHHEPMLRAQQEWKRYGKGAWNYDTNKQELDSFWKKGIENMDHHESIVTIGMRGDGDMPMTQGTAINLLENIVANQRKIIEEVTGKPASETPQDWALYKEVQDYYDKGMRVPDDVTLLFSDDNWGNLRRLPKLNAKPRSGGYGIYYHFDYVGGPRNYKWINTNNIARVWEQMHLAYSYGIDRIWVVNVGDLKPMELPISFFLDYAWNPNKITVDNIGNYYREWASKQFGENFGKQIGDVLQKYSQYISGRKPELLSPETYSLTAYNEADRVINQYQQLVAEAEKINNELPSAYKDAYFELVLFPVKAFVNLNELYVAVAKNRMLASENNIAANKYADEAKGFYKTDSLLSYQYNHELANGKWNHMMDQTHIGYTYWQQPRFNKMPEVKYISDNAKKDESVKIDVKDKTAVNLIPKDAKGNIFYEKNGYVSIEAANYSKAVNKPASPADRQIKWKVIPGIGKDGDGVTTFPVTADEKTLTNGNPYLQYEMYVYDTGTVKLDAYFSPTLNFKNDSLGLQYAISIDNEKPQIISINKDDKNERTWGKWVSNNIIIKTTQHEISKSGRHIIKYWMISPAVILQKIVLDFGGLKPSYLGPQETLLKSKNN